MTAPEKGFGWVDDRTPELAMSVLAGYRGKGIGGRLLAALLEKASSSFNAVCLSVDKTNPATRLYERFGFETVGSVGSSWTMVKRLKPQT